MLTTSSRSLRRAPRGRPRGAFALPLLLLACAAAPKRERGSPAGGLGGGLDAPADSGSGPEAQDTLLLDGLLQPEVLRALQGAEARVDVAQYTIWGGDLVDPLMSAVEAAAARGVAVRVLADETADGVEAALERVVAAGGEAKLDDPGVTMHHKLWIIDGVAFVGSHNLSDTGLGSNREASARVESAEAVAGVQAQLDALWADSGVRPAAAPAGGDGARVAFEDAVLTEQLACIAGAQDRVRVGLYAAAYDPAYPGSEVDQLLGALEAAFARGVDVTVLLDDSDWIRDNEINVAAIDRLRSAGLPVRRAARDELVHAKTLVCDDVALVSDANWSHSGLALYHAAAVRLPDPAEADALADWIDRLYGAGAE
jgi:phosphatidylserine/phosphatidylglycerophosphate/cardiolipin synthase-like enzyme